MCMKIRRGVSGAVADTEIASSPEMANRNAGAGLAMSAGQVGSGLRQSLLRFDLSAIPAGVALDSSTMVLTARPDSSAGLLRAHEVNVDWSEATTWSRFHSATAPPFEPAILASSRGGAGERSLDVSALVSTWLLGKNHGVLLEQDGAPSSSFHTSEDPDPKLRPELEVCFTR